MGNEFDAHYLSGSKLKESQEALLKKLNGEEEEEQKLRKEYQNHRTELGAFLFWEKNHVQEQLIRNSVAIVKSPVHYPCGMGGDRFIKTVSDTIQCDYKRMRTGYYPIPKEQGCGMIRKLFFELFPVTVPVDEFIEFLREHEYECEFGIDVKSVMPIPETTALGAFFGFNALLPFRVIESYRWVIKIWAMGDAPLR